MRDVAAPCVVAAACYLSGLHGEFLDDDPLAIVDNPDARGDTSLRALLLHDFWGTPLASPASHLSWRPLTIMAFRLQHALVGFDAHSFHAVNLALHAAVTALFALVCRPLLPFRSQRRLAALAFAAHAVHVESVTNCVGRAELLSQRWHAASRTTSWPRCFGTPTTASSSSWRRSRSRRWCRCCRTRLLSAPPRG